MIHKKPVIQLIRTEVFTALLNDPEWSQRYAQCKTFAETVEVVNEYARSHGKKTKNVIVA